MREVIAGASVYEKKYYFNPKFEKMPEDYKQKIKDWIIAIVEKVHGIIMIGFEQNGEVYIEYSCNEYDYHFDEIGAGLECKKFQMENQDWFNDLRIWYCTFFMEEGQWILKVAQEIQKGNTIEKVLEQWKQEYSNEQMQEVLGIIKSLTNEN